MSMMSMVSMEPCRFDTGCWRPLFPYGHSGRGRAARWAALWSLLAKQEVEDDLEVVKVIPVEAGSERFVEQNADVPVPPVVAVVEITPAEHLSERTQIVDVPVPLDQPGEQACRLPADTVHRLGYCRRACCDAATGSVSIAHAGDQTRRDSADAAHRRGCCRAYYDTATGPSVTDGFKDCESPEPVPPSQEEIDETIKLFPVERIPERNGDHFVDVPVPQTSEEVAEVVKAVKETPRKKISEEMIEVFSLSLVLKFAALIPNSSSRPIFQ